MKIGEFHRSPLNIIAGHIALSADVVGVDRCLVPVDMDNGVSQGGRAGGSHGLTNTARCHTPFALHNIDARWIPAVVVQSTKGQSKGTGKPNS